MFLAKKILTYYVFSNLHVGLAGFCLTEITLINFGIFGNETSWFVGLSIVLSYNFIRFVDRGKERHSWFRNWFSKNKVSLVLLSLAALLGLLFVILSKQFDFKRLIILIPFLLMTLFYVIPITKQGKITYSFRSFPGLKIFSISIAWAGVTVLFPIYEAGMSMDTSVFIEFFQRVCFVLAITIPFDIRDMQLDEKTMVTLPQLLGLKGVKVVGLVVVVIFVILEAFQNGGVNNSTLAVLITGLLIAVLLGISTPNKNRFFSSFWVEAIPIFWFGLINLFLLS